MNQASSTDSMSSSTAANTSTPRIDSSDDDSINFPLWRYVTKLEKMSTGKGGSIRWRCNLCSKTVVGSYSRVSAHLLQEKGKGVQACPKITPEIKIEIQRLVFEVEERNRPREVPLPRSSAQLGVGSIGSHSVSQESDYGKKRRVSPIEKAFNNEARDTLKSMIARMFYASGLPFHFARSPYYVKAFSYAANNNISGFIPPGYNTLRTTLLQEERANIERMLEPIKGTWPEKGVTIVSDGWSDPQRRPLINFIAITEGGPMFLKAVNCEGERKDKHFIAALLGEVIVEVGPRNVVQVITDNAAACKSAGHLIEARYPHIFWTPCVVHTLNLALKNICDPTFSERTEDAYFECSWIADMAGDAMQVKNFICMHSMRLAIFNEFVPLKLLSIAKTRFASTLVMLKRFKLIKRGLQAMVISERWNEYRDDDVGKAKFVKDTVLDDIWWDKVDYLLSFTNPIYDILRFADTDKPCLHLMYEMWDSMIEKVKRAIYRHEGKEDSEESKFYSVVHEILVARWTKSSTPLHCLAHSLNPRYYSKEWLEADPSRVPPHRDVEISDERNKCLRRYFPDNEDRKKAIVEYCNFSGASAAFSTFDSLGDRGSLDPRSWWINYGASAPILQKVALKLLGQPCSSSCCERNWSTYSFIHSMKRNKIQPQRAEDLVFVHTNLRLLSRRDESYTKGEGQMWDIGGDAFEPFDGAGELSIANLSLDEPTMETMFFDEGANQSHGGDDDDDVMIIRD